MTHQKILTLKEAQEELKKLDGIAKKSESAARNPLPPNFMSHLREAISNDLLKRDDSGDDLIGEILLYVSKSQADNGYLLQTHERFVSPCGNNR
jgi:hypothetical protein